MTQVAELPAQHDLQIRHSVSERQAEILSAPALAFVQTLVQRHAAQRDVLLEARAERQALIDSGRLPDFAPETAAVREQQWTVEPPPDEVLDRRTEITGPPDRKMVINALNSGAQVYMCDFEDSAAPTWSLMIDGQINLYDALRRQIDFTADNGKHYALNDETAVLMVRPRGLHLPEAHIEYQGGAIPGALLDFALYLFHNHQALKENGSQPYFYLPKLEHYLEARWWQAVISDAESLLGLEEGTVRVTVLIETLPAVFQMNEILHELRNRILGLNCGRWDYIFSYIKTFQAYPQRKLPDRALLTMDRGFLHAYSRLLIDTCHRRGAHAMGGMAAQIPVRDDAERNAEALQKVRADKAREARDGHDGTWVAHPGLEPLARAEFDAVMTGPNQKDWLQQYGDIGADALLAHPRGPVTADGVHGNIRIALQYIAAWLQGSGCVPINHLMEDAATAEIARAQLWQWVRHAPTILNDGQILDADSYPIWQRNIVSELAGEMPAATLKAAADILGQLVLSSKLQPFFTLTAYPRLLSADSMA
ncbi:MAG: malate synthase A [Wenzhouxiangellaceae bacterium]